MTDPNPNPNEELVQLAASTQWLRPGEAAALVGRTTETISNWADEGRVIYRKSAKGSRSYRLDSVLLLAELAAAAKAAKEAAKLAKEAKAR